MAKYTGFVEVTIKSDWGSLKISRIATNYSLVSGRLNYYWVDYIKPLGRLSLHGSVIEESM